MKGVFRVWVVPIALLVAAAAAADDVVTRAGGVIDNNTTWEGRVQVEREVTVAGGATLTVKPGTVVSFRKGAGLVVDGVLVARGSREAPIRFASAEPAPGRGDWPGIRLQGAGKGTVLERCRILHAEQAIAVHAGDPGIRDSEMTGGKRGVGVERKAAPALTGNTITDMTEGGISCQQGGSPTIERNVLRGCGPVGIFASSSAAPVVRGNTVEECGQGLATNGAIPPIEGNVFRKNGAGVHAAQCGRDQVVRGNRFEGNDAGLVCEQFSDPLVEGNTFTGNRTALVCFRSSSPLVRRNEIAGNDQGIVCIQLCHPRIEGNEIRGNGKGIILTLSSYATVTGNNIHGNAVQMELGNMSYDWERRVREKPVRGNVAQLATQIGRGVAGSREIKIFQGDNAVVTATVDAAGNWWGEKDTAEMERKGPDANIGGLIDYYDVPMRTYEGDPVEYVQDRIRYDGWRKTRIPEAGAPGKGKESGG